MPWTGWTRRFSIRLALGVAVAALLVLGVALALALADRPAQARARVPSRADTWVWHYAAAGETTTLPIFRRLLAAKPAATTVCVATSSAEDPEIGRRALGGGIAYVTVDGPVTGWARDRYVFFERGGVPHVLVPAERLTHPHTHGDRLVPQALRRLFPDLVLVETDFLIEGGDVLVLPDRVLLGAMSVLVNTDTLGPGAEPFLARVASIFGREVLVVGRRAGRPLYPHLDMVLAAIDERTVVLGDPRLALDVFRDERGGAVAQIEERDLGVFLESAQYDLVGAYESVAGELRDAGFEVRRLPVLHGEPWRGNPWGAVLNWTNVLLEVDAGRRLVFLPRYDVPLLDARARSAWEGWGFAVVDVDMRLALAHGGALRCVTNVMPCGRAPVPGTGAP